MKRSIIIVISIFGVAALVAFYIFSLASEIADEKSAYVHNLNFHLSATVDTVVTTREGRFGFFLCKPAAGTIKKNTEDSLNLHLKNYKKLKFIYFRPRDRIRINTAYADKIQPGDSIAINSNNDELKFYRKGIQFLDTDITSNTFEHVSFAFWIKD